MVGVEGIDARSGKAKMAEGGFVGMRITWCSGLRIRLDFVKKVSG